MRPTMSQLRRWHPCLLADVGTKLVELNRGFDDGIALMDHRVDSVREHWQGQASTAIAIHLFSERLITNHVSTAVLAIADVYGDAAAALGPAQRTAIDIADDAIINHGMAVSDDGRVTPPTISTGDAKTDMVMQSKLNDDARNFEARLTAVLDSVGHLDSKSSAEMARALDKLDQLTTDPSESRTPANRKVIDILDGTASLPQDPKKLNEFWESLTPFEKDALAANDPMIGNRDGLPVVDKDRYNRQHIESLESQAQGELDALEREHPDWAEGDRIPIDADRLDDGTGIITAEDHERRDEYEEWVSGREAATTTAAGYRAVQEQLKGVDLPKYLLSIDDQGRGAIALNNPDNATNVATFVPGTGSELSKINSDVSRCEALLRETTSAQQEALAKGQSVAGGSTSVVVWYGYNAPPTIPEAGLDKFADDGAPRLDSFQDGLRASHDGAPSHNTIVGHSYGSTVVGTAASGDGSLAVDDLVFVGSPGANVDGDVRDLKLDGISPDDVHAHVYATAAAWDPVPRIGDAAAEWVHGWNPADPDFGATVFTSDPGSPGMQVHSDYWEEGNPSLQNQGRIIAGVGGVL